MYGDPNAGGGTEDKEDATGNIESPTKSKETAIDKTEAKLDPSESANGEIDDCSHLPIDDKDLPSERQPRRAVRSDVCSEVSQAPRGGRRSNRDGVKIPRSSSRDAGRRRPERIGCGEVTPPRTRTESKNGQSEVEHRSSENKDGGKEAPTEGFDDQSVRSTRTSSRPARRRPSGDASETSSMARAPGRDSARRRPSGDVVANADVPETSSRASRDPTRKTHDGGSQRSSSRDPHQRTRNGDEMPTQRSRSRDPARRTAHTTTSERRGRIGNHHSAVEDQTGSSGSSGLRAPRSSSRDARPRRSGSRDVARIRRGNREGGSVVPDQPESSEADKVEPTAAEENKKSVDEPKIKVPEVEEEDEKEERAQMSKTQEPKKNQVTEEVSTTEPCESLLHEPNKGDIMEEKDSIVEKQTLRDVDSIDENERVMELDTASNEEKQTMKEAKQEAGQTPDEQEDEPEFKASLQRKLLSPVAEAKPSIMKSNNASEINPSAKTANASSEANPAMNLLDYMDTISYEDLRPKSEHQRVPEKEAYKAEPLSSVSTHSLPARPSKNMYAVSEAASTAAKDFAQVDELFQSMGKKKPNRRTEGTDYYSSDDESGLIKGKAPAVTGEGRKIKKAQSAWDMMGGDNASYEGGDPERKELAPPTLAGDRGTKGKKIRRTKASEGYDDEKHLPPPSLAGDEYKKSRKVVKAKHIDDYDSSLEPPSLAPMSKPSKPKPKDHDSDGDEEHDTFDDVLPIKKGIRKITRTPNAVGLPAPNLAPPSLAGDEQRIDDRKHRKKSSKSRPEGDDKAAIDKRAAIMSAKRAESFSVLMDSDGDDDSVGDIPETSVGEVSRPKSSVGREMMTKAKSVTNLLKGKKSSSSSGELREKKIGKKAFSLRNLAV